jgi:hypothetical protein
VVYVPGHKHDLFVSYARAELAWVEAFRVALSQGVLEKIGAAPAIWQDIQNIRFGQDWPEEIQKAIHETAVFLAIWSPAYYQSEWCAREHDTFAPKGSLDGLKAGSFHRFLKIVKTPHPDKLHRSFFEKLQPIEFFNKAEEEYLPGSAEFAFQVRRAASAIAELLRTMRNGKQPIYLASVASDLWEEREQLRTQLLNYGYDVRPEGNLTPAYGDVAERELERSILAIVLLGGVADEFVEHQIRTAKDLGRRAIVWVHPRKAKDASGRQAELISRIRDLSDAPPGSQVLGGSSIHDVFRDLVELLAPRRTGTSTSSDKTSRIVYLMHDTTQPLEAERADRVRALIREQQITVVPDTNASLSLDSDERFMQECDGLLLFRGDVSGPDQWLYQNLRQVRFADKVYERKEPLKAKALLLANPALAESVPGVDVLPYAEPFTATVLQPFFAKMREMRRAHADS